VHGHAHAAARRRALPCGALARPAEGVPWHAVVMIIAGLALLIAVEITLDFGIAKLVTGDAY
jgi:hypothetical protein